MTNTRRKPHSCLVCCITVPPLRDEVLDTLNSRVANERSFVESQTASFLKTTS